MRLIALLLLMACVCGCTKTRETVLSASYDQDAMNQAIEKARSEVDFFVKEVAEPMGEDHAVKVALTDGDKTEHVWLTDLSFADDKFTGTINNSPNVVTNVSMGETKTVAKSEITDWMFIYNFKMFGNFTVRPFLDNMPEKEAEAMRRLLAE